MLLSALTLQAQAATASEIAPKLRCVKALSQALPITLERTRVNACRDRVRNADDPTSHAALANFAEFTQQEGSEHEAVHIAGYRNFLRDPSRIEEGGSSTALVFGVYSYYPDGRIDFSPLNNDLQQARQQVVPLSDPCRIDVVNYVPRDGITALLGRDTTYSLAGLISARFGVSETEPNGFMGRVTHDICEPSILGFKRVPSRESLSAREAVSYPVANTCQYRGDSAALSYLAQVIETSAGHIAHTYQKELTRSLNRALSRSMPSNLENRVSRALGRFQTEARRKLERVIDSCGGIDDELNRTLLAQLSEISRMSYEELTEVDPEQQNWNDPRLEGTSGNQVFLSNLDYGLSVLPEATASIEVTEIHSTESR
ncbi:MAG: hypothetical protein AAF202_06885 [Pseudomonadota bacterium]